MYGYVYETTNLITGRMYIGAHSDEFNPNYKGSNRDLKSDVKKYGPENFSVRLLVVCESLEELQEAEVAIQRERKVDESDDYYNRRINHAGICDDSLRYSPTGRVWITDGTVDRHVFPEEVSNFKGFELGRSKGTPSSESRIGTIHITNGEVNKIIRPEEFPLFKSEGFRKGMTYPKNRKPPKKPATAGYKWVNDGSRSWTVPKDKLSEVLSDKVVVGRLPWRHSE